MSDGIVSLTNKLRRVLRRLTHIGTVLVLFVILSAAYSLATPIFETPDEMAHFAYIKRLADGHGFPAAPIVVADEEPAQESSQPPLYYLSAALAVRLFAPETGDLAVWQQRNPAFPYIFGTIHHDNKNLVIHARPETFPYEGAARALHVVRLVTLLFGALTVWGTYRLGREIFLPPSAIGLLAAALVAFTPQFLFISGAASNDPAAAALSALSLWATVYIMRRGFTLRRVLLLGLALSLATLSKASAVGLIPLCLLAVSFVGNAPTIAPFTKRLGWSLLIVAVIGVLAGPWYLRTALVFGDVLGTSTHMAMSWARPVPLTVLDAASKLPYATTSYWLAFGWGNILAPDWLYWLLNGLMLLGLIGALAWWWRQRNSMLRIERASVLLLGGWVAVIVAALIRWIQLLDAAIGRLLFPAIAALSILLVLGWLHWCRRTWLVALVPAGLLVLSILALPFILATAYAWPTLLSAADLAGQPGRAIDVRFSDVASLVRLDVPRDHWAHPGEGVTLLLCWEPLKQDDRLLMELVQIVGENNRVWFTRRTVPGLGSYPTKVWQPNGIFCDPIHLQIDEKTPAGVYRVEVALIDQGTQERLPAYAPDGSQLTTNFVGQIKIAPPAYVTPPIDHPLSQRLGDQFELLGYDLDRGVVKPGESFGLRTYWRALRRPDADYTIFAQVRAATNQVVGQKDAPPQAGAYPTSFWDAGEVVIDDRVIDIPADALPGKYPIKLGLYLPAGGARLKVDDGPADEVTLPQELDVQP